MVPTIVKSSLAYWTYNTTLNDYNNRLKQPTAATA